MKNLRRIGPPPRPREDGNRLLYPGELPVREILPGPCRLIRRGGERREAQRGQDTQNPPSLSPLQGELPRRDKREWPGSFGDVLAARKETCPQAQHLLYASFRNTPRGRAGPGPTPTASNPHRRWTAALCVRCPGGARLFPYQFLLSPVPFRQTGGRAGGLLRRPFKIGG